MRLFRAILSLLIFAAWVYLLNNPIGSTLPAIGKLFDPFSGCWTSAEPVNKNFSSAFKLPGLQGPASVWFDERLVPHVNAINDHDLYFIQGYIHAYFRLWQMDMQTRAAAGRVSEIVGEKTLQFDRTQRRKGMVYAAEHSLAAMEADPRTKLMSDAYTAGINYYISSLNYRNYPLEYKLMGFAPEKWTNLKTALLLKYMADDLTGKTDDIAYSILRDKLPDSLFNIYFPDRVKGSDPVIPEGTQFEPAVLKIPTPPASPDSLFPSLKQYYTATAYTHLNEESGIGSNNWALSGVRTKTGAPILCNDPHLALNLPSLWYEMQLQAPGLNVYGVSLPGAPGIIIGFNDSVSWGLTNNYRDVKDFYLLKTDGNNGYYMDGKLIPFKPRLEKIAVKNKDTFSEVVNYTIHGPVMYDDKFTDTTYFTGHPILAMCWMAHRSTNELLAIYLLNRSHNYPDFTNAIQNFQCPAQNMLYADKAGNIALWGQGQFIDKWKGQGKYVMDGSTSKTLWGNNIPMFENPNAFDPPQGYLASANQCVTDSTYPYWYNGNFLELRAWRINQLLDPLHNATVEDMFAIQNDTYSYLAAHCLRYLLNALPVDMTGEEKKYADSLRNWNLQLNSESIAASVFQIWWYYFSKDLWAGFGKTKHPNQEVTMQILEGDTALRYMNITQKAADSMLRYTVRRQSFKEAIDSIKKLENSVGVEWYKVKNTTIKHLARLTPFSYPEIKIGGWSNVINAATSDHGPSWRMVVQMSSDIEAYGVYPGGQSGNPGSSYYGSFINDWAEGKYYKLLFLQNSTVQNDHQLKYTWKIQP
jgi:penicillin amidase